MRVARAGAVLVVGMAITACGGEGEPEGAGTPGAGEEELKTVTVGLLPVANVAPVYLGIDQGFFEEEGLELELSTSQGGAAIVPSVVSGDFEFGYGNVVSLMQARDKGLDLKIVTGSTQGADSEESIGNGLLVAEDSGIDSVEDLAGKTVAVTTLHNLGELTTRAALESEGVDHATLQFVEMGFPDMNQAVLTGNVDVAWQAEPFVTLGEEQGLRNIIDPFLATMPRLDAAVYFTSGEYMEQNPEVVEGFQRAMAKSMEYARENEQETREEVLTYTEIPSEVAEKMRLAVFSPTVNLPSIELQAELAREYGMVEEEVDIDALLAPGAADE